MLHVAVVKIVDEFFIKFVGSEYFFTPESIWILQNQRVFLIKSTLILNIYKIASYEIHVDYKFHTIKSTVISSIIHVDYDNQHGFFLNPRGFMIKYLWILEILAWILEILAWIPRIPVYCLTDHHRLVRL